MAITKNASVTELKATIKKLNLDKKFLEERILKHNKMADTFLNDNLQLEKRAEHFEREFDCSNKEVIHLQTQLYKIKNHWLYKLVNFFK